MMNRLYQLFPIMKDEKAMGTLRHPKVGPWTVEYYEHEKEE